MLGTVSSRLLVGLGDSLEIRYCVRALSAPIWPTGKWPLDERDPGDVGAVARLCRWLEFDEVDLLVTECRTRNLVREPSVHRAIQAVASELLEHGALEGRRVYELVSEADVDESAVRLALVRG